MANSIFVTAFCLLVACGLARPAAPTFHLPEVVTVPFSDKAISNVTELTTLDDALRMLRSESDMFVAFVYDSLDVNSWRTAPTIAEAAGLLLGFVEVVAVDSRNANLSFLLSAWNAQVVPTLFLVPSHGTHRASLGAGLKGVGGVKRPVEFAEQDLHPTTIRNWALKGLPANLVEKLDDDKLQGLLLGIEQAQSSIVILFTDKESTPPLLRRLSLKFFQRIGFAEVNGKRSPKITKHFKISSFPTLLVFPGPGFSASPRVPITYTGALNVGEISVFLASYAPSPQQREEVRRAAEEAALRRERRRLSEDVLEIASEHDWLEDVLSRQAVVGLLFTTAARTEDTQSDLTDKLASLTEAKRRSGRSSVVSQYFRVDASESESRRKLLDQLGGPQEDGSAVLVFLHPSKGLFTRFAGAFSPDGIIQFISTKIRTGMSGAKSVSMQKLSKF
jgi:hypothetical protein